MSSRTRKQQRGQAAVELAVTMIMLVPLIFFALFLQDFAYYKLEGQEPVVTANSEFIVNDFMTESSGWSERLQHYNRLKYCDHTAGYDSYDRDFECDGASSSAGGGGGGGFGVTGGAAGDLGHHHATGAHQCWIGGGQQVTCTVSKGADAMMMTGGAFTTYYWAPDMFGNWNMGGIATCSAQLKIFNWIIPRQLGAKGAWSMQDSQASAGGNLALGDKKQFGNGGGDVTGSQREWNENYAFKNVHDDGTASAGMGSWLLAKQEYSILSDPWALNHINATDPHADNPFTTFIAPGTIPGSDSTIPFGDKNQLLNRTGHYYNHYAEKAADKAMKWEKAMKDKDFLDEFAGWDVAGDELHSVPVTWMPAKPRSRNNGYASGYEDQRQQSANRSQKYPSDWGKN